MSNVDTIANPVVEVSKDDIWEVLGYMRTSIDELTQAADEIAYALNRFASSMDASMNGTVLQKTSQCSALAAKVYSLSDQFYASSDVNSRALILSEVSSALRESTQHVYYALIEMEQQMRTIQ